jgi:2-polyprenyl-6-methoxyphenol hydroxylase-like FAD-dependent oxidoreductase
MYSSASDVRHAVVIGASLAGLCAARTLADHYERVSVVERDRLPDGPQIRKGVPQAHHLHVLVMAGQRALDRLFPGLMTELHDLGAVPVAAPTDILYLTATGWRERFPATHGLVGASRELIDWAVRRRLLANPRIRFLAGHDAVGLVPGPAADAIAGVRVRDRDGGEPVELAADLVVDASGRNSHTPDWLDVLGYGRPRESRIDSGLGYASRRYRLPDAAVNGWKNILLMPDPPHTARGGVLYPVENGRWMATLGGLGEDCPPTDEAGFLEFARSLRSPVMYEAIRDAEPDSPIHGFRQTANHRRYYESMARWPDGFLVVGDAACVFNPVYGHGMSVAALTAVALAGHLRARPGVLGRAAQATVARCSAQAWAIATGADLRYSTTTGARRRRRDRWADWYLDRTTDVANRDREVSRVLTDVLHLLAPPAALMRPAVALRVLRGRPGPRLWTLPEPTGAVAGTRSARAGGAGTRSA